jgi:hypothetical protein
MDEDKPFPPSRQAKGEKDRVGRPSAAILPFTPSPAKGQESRQRPSEGLLAPPQPADDTTPFGLDQPADDDAADFHARVPLDFDEPADDDIPFDVGNPSDDVVDPYARVTFAELGATFHPLPPNNAQAAFFRDAFITALAGAVGAIERRLEIIEARQDEHDRQRTRARLTVIEGDKP